MGGDRQQAGQVRQGALRILGQSLAPAVGQGTPRSRRGGPAGRNPTWLGLFEHTGGNDDRSLHDLVRIRAATAGGDQ
jgi:hypothetical protein